MVSQCRVLTPKAGSFLMGTAGWTSRFSSTGATRSSKDSPVTDRTMDMVSPLRRSSKLKLCPRPVAIHSVWQPCKALVANSDSKPLIDPGWCTRYRSFYVATTYVVNGKEMLTLLNGAVSWQPHTSLWQHVDMSHYNKIEAWTPE